MELDEELLVTVLKILAMFVLSLLSAAFSGLDLGLMSLNPGQLEVIIQAGNCDDPIAKRNAKRAKRILPVRRDGNLLLCTLLFGNIAVNSAMAVLMADFTTGIFAGLVVTFIIVTFGEIIPQSLCYKHGLFVGSTLLPLLQLFKYTCYLWNKPTALLLDCILGQPEESLLNQKQMKCALAYQLKHDPNLLSNTESALIKGSLEFTELTVKDVTVPFEKAFCLDINALINESLMQAVIKEGYSRLPVVDYSKNVLTYGHPSMVGLLHVKDLLVVDPSSSLPVRTLLPLLGRELMVFEDDQPLSNLLRAFRSGTSQLACVTTLVCNENQDPHWRHSGIVALQDVLNAIVQHDLKEKEEVKTMEQLRVFSNARGMDAFDSSVVETARRVPPLGEAEAVAVAAFLTRMYYDVFGKFSHETMLGFVRGSCEVREWTAGQALYERGSACDFACLVLLGEVQLYAGREAFRSTSTSWSFLGQKALSMDEDYVPDFSAYPDSGVRLLICRRSKYKQLLSSATTWEASV